MAKFKNKMEMHAGKVRRTHKDSLFRMIFSTKEELLSLYNAVNGSDYQNPEDLEIHTIENVIYMGMKNDISFLVDDYLSLYEAQSSWNPNMPLRGVFYLSQLYQGYVAANDFDVYSKVQLKLPTPKYLVFYNGERQCGDKEIQRLSDSFLKKDDGEEHALECVATVLNINYGHNRELMEGRRKLYEYAYFIKEIRYQLARGVTRTAAVDMAVETCIREGILADFLKKHRAEVRQVILTEYNEELHIKSEKELARSEGRQQILVEMVCRKLRKGKTPECIAEELEEDIARIRQICDAAEVFAPEYDENAVFESLMEK